MKRALTQLLPVARLATIPLLLTFPWMLDGCGSGSASGSTPTPSPLPITVSVAASGSPTLSSGQSVVITATLTNDSTNAGVQWSVTGGGTLTNASTTSVTYVAPGSSAGPITATVTATSIADNTKSASLQIAVSAPLTMLTTSLSQGSVGTAYAQTLQAVGGAPPYIFVIVSGTLPSDLTINASGSGVIAGVPSAAGTATFAIAAHDSAGATVTGDFSLSITASNCPNNASLHGNYAFLFAGVGDSGGFRFEGFVGSFVADGAGNISQGMVDSEDSFAPGGTSKTITGTYCVSGSNLATLKVSGLDIQGFSPIVNVLQMALQSDGNGSGILYDNPSSVNNALSPFFSGTVWKQDTSAFDTAKINAHYALGFFGGAGGNFAPPYSGTSEGGRFTADGAGNLSGALAVNVEGLVTSASVTSNDLAAAASGRGSATLNLTNLINNLSFIPSTASVIFYVVNAKHLLALQSGVSPTVLAGEILQGSNGPFTQTSMNGVSVIGIQARGQYLWAQAGLVTFDGIENYTYSVDGNQAESMVTSSPGALQGTYNVDVDGRVSLTNRTYPLLPIFYLNGLNQGFAVSPPFDINASFGFIANQVGTNFTNSSFSGTYVGTNAPGNQSSTPLELDVLTADGAGSLMGTSFLNSWPSGPSSTPVSASYTISSTGRGIVTENGKTTAIIYVISPTQALLLRYADPTARLIRLSR